MTIPEIEISILVSPQVCQRPLRQQQFEAPDGKILRVEMDEELPGGQEYNSRDE